VFPQEPFKVLSISKKVNALFECDRCGKSFENRMKLANHLNNHFRVLKHRCKGCEKSFSTVASLRKHYATTHKNLQFKEKRFACDECPKRYLTEFLLGQHKLSHENLREQRCDLCEFATNSPYDLKNHIKRIHEARKDFICPEEGCEKGFKRKCDMENHRKSVHSSFKVYVKCPTCDVIVLEKGLQSHMINRHSEKAQLKPFICPVCGKAERYEKNLTRHFAAVHDPTDRGVTYPCPECSQIFYRRRDLTAHSFEHYEGLIHECGECGNKYKSKKELTNHVSHGNLSC
jgi:KRAB domain-containing zinc finger protein